MNTDITYDAKLKALADYPQQVQDWPDAVVIDGIVYKTFPKPENIHKMPRTKNQREEYYITNTQCYIPRNLRAPDAIDHETIHVRKCMYISDNEVSPCSVCGENTPHYMLDCNNDQCMKCGIYHL